MKDILREIDRLRMKRGWSERELACRSGLRQSTISGCYRERRNPTIAVLAKICSGLGVTLSQFFAEPGDPISLTAEQKEMLVRWSELDETSQAVLRDLLKTMPNPWVKS